MEGYARTRSVSMVPGIILGLGFGGFADGIVLHQIAQWHSMGSSVVPPTSMGAIRLNMMWDGYFHAAMLVLSVFGAYFLLRDAKREIPMPGARVFTGQMILGWGIFNLVEGIINHHLLNIHHVRDLPVHMPAWDWTFLGVGGFGLIVLGWLLSRVPRAPVVRGY